MSIRPVAFLPVEDVRRAIRELQYLGRVRDHIDRQLATAVLTPAQRNQLLRDIILIDTQADELVRLIRSAHDPGSGMGLRRGRGLRSFTQSIPRRVRGLLHGSTQGPEAVRTLLSRHGNERILSIRVCRKPIQGAIERVINIASRGALSRVKSRLGYDHLMHLYAYINTDQGTHFLTEKNEIVSVRYENIPQEGAQCRLVKLPTRRITVAQLFNAAERAEGTRFWKYDALNERGGGNCQLWITWLLRSSGLLTPELSAWINQDIAAIARAAPPGFGEFAHAVTELAARLKIGVLGEGVARWTRLPPPLA